MLKIKYEEPALKNLTTENMFGVCADGSSHAGGGSCNDGNTDGCGTGTSASNPEGQACTNGTNPGAGECGMGTGA